MTMPRWAAKWICASVATAAMLAAVEPVRAEDELVDEETVVTVVKPAKARKTAAVFAAQPTPQTAPPPHTASPAAPGPTAETNAVPATSQSTDPWSETWVDETMDDCLPPVWSHWTINLDAILWRRQTPDGLRLAVSNPGVDPDAASLTFDHEVGPRLGLIRRGISGWDVELNYFGIEGFRSSLNMPNAVDPRVPGDDPDGLFYSEAQQILVVGMGVRYDSRLHSEELNLRRQLNDTWTGLIGIRCLQLHENFHVDTINAGVSSSFYSIEAENRLFGLQIGGEGKLLSTERFLLWTTLKAGLFENNSEQSTTDLAGGLSGVVVLPGTEGPSLRASTNQAAFAGELGLMGTYRLSESILLRAGYNVMWLDDVALASEQLVVNEFGPGERRDIRADGSLFYHGVTMGVELTW